MLFFLKINFRNMGMKKKDDNQVEKKINKHPVLYIFSAIILVIIIVTFVGAPIASNFSGGQRIVFGEYDGEKIEYYPGNYLSNQKDMLAQKIDKNNSGNFQLQAYQVWRGAYERTVLHVALLKEVIDSGFIASQDKIDTAVVKYGPYTVNGEFSPEKYSSASNMEKKQNRKYIEETVIKEQYINDYFYGKKISTAEKDFIKDMASVEKSFNIVKLPFSDYPDSEVESYKEENENLFRSMTLSKITVLSDKKDAEKVYQIVKDNPDSFADNAKNHSKDSYSANGGDMGNVYYYNLKTELKNADDAEKVFSLSNGSISSLLETNNGWVIYKSSSSVNSEADNSKVKEYMMRYELGKIEDYFTAQAENLKNSGNLISAALDNDYEVIKTDSFPINYGNSMFFKPVKVEDKDKSLTNLGYNDEFLQAAFSLDKGEISEPVIVNNAVLVITLDSVSESEGSMNELLDSYYPYIVQQMNDSSLSSFYITSDKVKDNFNETFSKYFLSN